MRRGEALFLAFVLVFGVALAGLDAAISSPPRPPKAAREDFMSAGWYCPVPIVPGAQASMSAANLGATRVKLRQLAVGEGSESPAREANLRAGRRASAIVGELSSTKGLGLTEAFGSPVAATVSLLGPDRGVAASGCSSEPGSRWLFAGASSLRRQDTHLLVGNPFREEAVIRVRLMDPDKESIPALLRDLVIPPLSQTPVFLGDFTTESASFGLEVTATQGRVVVSRYSQYATREGVKGIALAAGVKQPELNWNFAGGRVPTEGEEWILAVNPNPKEALVQIIFQTGTDQVAPQALNEFPVPAGRQVRIKVSDFLPRGTEHGTQVVSSNGVSVVAERETTAEVSGDRGYEIVFGVPEPARRWAVTAGSNAAGSDSLAIINHGTTAARIGISLVTDAPQLKPKELQGLRIGPDRRQTVDLTPFLPQGGATVVVSGSAPITVENLLVLGPPYSDFSASHGEPT